MRKIEDKILELEKEIVRLETENEIINKQVDEIEEANKNLLERLNLSKESVKLIERIAYNRRYNIKVKLESLISDCIKTVYGNEYNIKIEYSLKNNRSYVDILIEKETPEGLIKRKVNGFGGGVSDVISFPLKLLVLITNNKIENILLADECGKHIDAERMEKFAFFMSEVVKQLKIQLILLTHHQCVDEYGDVIYNINNDKNLSKITRVKDVKKN